MVQKIIGIGLQVLKQELNFSMEDTLILRLNVTSTVIGIMQNQIMAVETGRIKASFITMVIGMISSRIMNILRGIS